MKADTFDHTATIRDGEDGVWKLVEDNIAKIKDDALRKVEEQRLAMLEPQEIANRLIKHKRLGMFKHEVNYCAADDDYVFVRKADSLEQRLD